MVAGKAHLQQQLKLGLQLLLCEVLTCKHIQQRAARALLSVVGRRLAHRQFHYVCVPGLLAKLQALLGSSVCWLSIQCFTAGAPGILRRGENSAI